MSDEPDNTYEIAEAICAEEGWPETYWRFIHPIVKATIRWLDEENYLRIVVPVGESNE